MKNKYRYKKLRETDSEDFLIFQKFKLSFLCERDSLQMWNVGGKAAGGNKENLKNLVCGKIT